MRVASRPTRSTNQTVTAAYQSGAIYAIQSLQIGTLANVSVRAIWDTPVSSFWGACSGTGRPLRYVRPAPVGQRAATGILCAFAIAGTTPRFGR
jgi:hypothetical protein